MESCEKNCEICYDLKIVCKLFSKKKKKKKIVRKHGLI